MNQIKFNVIRIVVNLIFGYLICVGYLYGVQNSGLFQIIPATIFFVFVVAVSVYNVRSQGFINALASGSLCLLMYILYIQVMKSEYDILSSDIWFIQIIRGAVTVTACLIVMQTVKMVLMPVLKYAQIYSLVNDTGVMVSIMGCITQFKSTASIPIFNWVVRKSFGEVFELVKQSCVSDVGTEDAENSTSSKGLSNLQGLLSNLADTRVGKASSKLLKLYADYPDECVLAYCYKNPETPMFNASLQGIGIFLKNAPILIGQIAATIVIEGFFRVILAVILFSVIKTHGIFSITNCIFYFLFYYLLQFILCSSIAEPVLMSSVVNTFLKKAEKEEDNLEQEVEEIFPGAAKLQRMFGGESTKKEPEEHSDNKENAAEQSEVVQEEQPKKENVEEQVEEQVTGTISAEDFKNSVM